MALVPMLCISIYSGLNFRQHAAVMAQENALRLIRLIGGEHKQAVNAARMLLLSLCEVPQLSSGASGEASELLLALLKHYPQFANIYAATPNGRIYASAVGDFTRNSFSDKKTLQQAVSSRRFTVGTYHTCPITGKMVITLVQPVVNNKGVVQRVLALDYDLAYAGQIIDMAGLPRGATFVMSDREGTILYRWPSPERWQGKPVQDSVQVAMLKEQSEGVLQGTGLDNVLRLYAFKPMSMDTQGNDIFLRMGIPEAEVLDKANAYLLTSIMTACLVALGVLIVGRVLCAKLLFDPMEKLIETSQRIAKGELQARTLLPHGADELGRLAFSFDAMADSLERRQHEQEQGAKELFESRERIRAMLNATTDSVILADVHGIIIDMNPIAAARRDKMPSELMGGNLLDDLPPASAVLRKEKMAQSAAGGAIIAFEEKRGQNWYHVRIHPIRDKAGNTVQLASFSRDITERKRFEERLTRQAYEDLLTELPNRALFLQQLELTMHEALVSKNNRYAVLFLDLDNFKLVNDSFGHHVGDTLLRSIGRRLHLAAGEHRLTARFGGDEFAILIPHVVDAIDVLRTADALHRALETPMQVQEFEIRCSASIGVVYGKPEYVTPEQVLRDADIAMYQAKALGRGYTECFTMDMRKQVMERMHLEYELREALASGQMLLYYQPYFSLPDRRLIGFEALVRWRHPTRGMVSPATFIPLSEETGLILHLGAFVMREACSTVAKWNDTYCRDNPLQISVNMSPRQMYQSDPVELVRDTLQQTGLSPNLLTLEITESMLVEDLEHAIDILGTLNHFGVRTALDDFGTGYSSLAYLRSLPLDVLKMDRSFIQRLDRDNRDADIASRIVALAHTLDLSVTAEGVETPGVLRKLTEMGCDTAQGYHLSKPMPQEDVEEMLRTLFNTKN